MIERATRSARLPAADLQDVFGDLSVTVHYLQGDDWTELAFYPATSTRASREQRQHVEQALLSWSEAVTAYLGAVRHLYAYMDDHPERAQPLFAAILGERVEVALLPLTEEEEPMADAVVAAMEEIAVRMDGEEARAIPLAEEVDMVFNPFPARVVVALPHEILTASGFTQIDSTSVAIEPIDLTTTLRELEGEWLSPDPLAALLRDETPTAADLAARERSAKIVTEPEVSELLRAGITRPRHHVVRWRH